jgi:hypothetical protein
MSLNRANWFFVIIAVVLIAVLAYYLTLTTRPEISQIRPAPNSSQLPGPVELSAVITSQRDIDEVRFFIDGESVSPQVDHNGNQRWTATYEQVFQRGEREVVLQVTDSSGRVTEHSWTFEAGGELVPPRLALLAPPSNATLATGTSGITIHATTFAEIDSVSVSLDGEPLMASTETVTDPASEYTTENDLSVYEWEITAVTEITAGTHELEATVTDIYGAETTGNWDIAATDSEEDETAVYFPETGAYTVEPFLSFWEESDGESAFGPAVGPPMLMDDGNEQQYFRYARLEVDDQGAVQIGLIGREIFGEVETPPDRPPGDGSRLFDPTGHYIHGAIREYWEANGGLSLFGYPISQEFTMEDGYAQYFERALIRVIEENGAREVERAPLGEQLYEELRRTETRERQEAPGNSDRN